MPDVWRVYRISNCRHTHPPENKFIVIVCQDFEYMGFLVNSKINQFILKRPRLLECQILLKQSDYHFLFHDSYLDCSQIFPFEDNELVIGLQFVSQKIKTEIKTIVSVAETIAKKYKDLITKN